MKQGCFYRWHRVGPFLLFLWMLNGCQENYVAMPPPTVKAVQIGTISEPVVKVISPSSRVNQTGQLGWERSWIPPRHLEEKSRWQGIVIHHSATDTGNAMEFDKLHKERRDNNGQNWLGLGYDFVITNGRGRTDGMVEVGWRWNKQQDGAHCRPKGCGDNYWNKHTIGICLVGNFEKYRPSRAQYDSLARLVSFLQRRYHIPTKRIVGHGGVPRAKTKCPGKNFSWWELKRRL